MGKKSRGIKNKNNSDEIEFTKKKAQVSLLEYIGMENELGKINMSKRLLSAMNSVFNELVGKFIYFPYKGMFYAVNIGAAMSVEFKSDSFKIPNNILKGRYFTMHCVTISELLKVLSTNVSLSVYEDAVSFGTKRLTRAFRTPDDADFMKYVNSNNIIKKYDYFKISVGSGANNSHDNFSKFINSLKWVIGSGSVKHNRITFFVKNGKFYVYDTTVSDVANWDEAKAVIASITDTGVDRSVTIKSNYIDMMRKFFTNTNMYKHNVSTYIAGSELPLVVKGKLVTNDKKKMKDEKATAVSYIFTFAPMVEGE